MQSVVDVIEEITWSKTFCGETVDITDTDVEGIQIAEGQISQYKNWQRYTDTTRRPALNFSPPSPISLMERARTFIPLSCQAINEPFPVLRRKNPIIITDNISTASIPIGEAYTSGCIICEQKNQASCNCTMIDWLTMCFHFSVIVECVPQSISCPIELYKCCMRQKNRIIVQQESPHRYGTEGILELNATKQYVIVQFEKGVPTLKRNVTIGNFGENFVVIDDDNLMSVFIDDDDTDDEG